MLQRRHDHDNLAVKRREDERMKKKEKQWKEDQKHLAEQQAAEEASAVNHQLLQAHLGPTPSRPGTNVTLYLLWPSIRCSCRDLRAVGVWSCLLLFLVCKPTCCTRHLDKPACGLVFGQLHALCQAVHVQIPAVAAFLSVRRLSEARSSVSFRYFNVSIF